MQHRQSKPYLLYLEAMASFLIIESVCAKNVQGGIIPDKLCKVYQNAQARCSRRFYLVYGGK